MCGIIGYVGSKKISNSVLIAGLEALEYRGYDSAGLAIVTNKTIQTIKEKGKVSNLKKKLMKLHLPQECIGIAHTRWATHGIPNEMNSHPHTSGKVTLVHNGIIENYHEIQNELEKAGYRFISDTDSEIASAYIDYQYSLSNDPQLALTKAYEHFRGSFAFAILFEDKSDSIYAMRKNSPLVLGVAHNQAFLASDISAFLSYTNQYINLNHEEIACLKMEGIQIKTLQGECITPTVHCSNLDIKAIQKDGYEHFMLKEIHEEPAVIKNTIDSFIQHDIKDLLNTMPNLRKYNNIHIVACGSAMYAGMIAKNLIESKAHIHVDCVCASEYRYSHPFFTPTTLVILVSQSGETADTIAALQLAQSNNVDTLAVVNVVGSSIAKEATYTLYTLAGAEICVATTKAYCTQVVVLSLLACYFAIVHGYMDEKEIQQITNELKNIHTSVQALIESKQYLSIAKTIYEHNDIFFIGRGLDYALSLEGSLKLKEISYIHSEAYPAGELKHGTISLIEEGTPIIAIATDHLLYEKTMSNVKEVKARGAHVILLISDDLKAAYNDFDEVITIPKTDCLLQGILSVLPLQLLAYEIAKLRGCEIDQPRNLAKSVTVE
ncbi:MAG: glutamine--fructose-6-phosphate transaminase (isomerizing) [Longicatena sp.]